MITFDNDDVLQPVAYIVENDLLLSAVGEELGGIENVTVVNDAKVKLYELPLEKNKTTKVKLEDGNVLQCSLLVSVFVPYFFFFKTLCFAEALFVFIGCDTILLQQKCK